MTELAAYICGHIFRRERPVLLASKRGGDWQFLCGAGHDEGMDGKAVGINHILEWDPTLLEIMDLETDWDAERDAIGQPWRRTPGLDEE